VGYKLHEYRVADELETVIPPRTGGAEKNIAIFAAKLVVTGANSGLPEFGTLSRRP
jgi:hypothetical protein